MNKDMDEKKTKHCQLPQTKHPFLDKNPDMYLTFQNMSQISGNFPEVFQEATMDIILRQYLTLSSQLTQNWTKPQTSSCPRL